jgi:hypothetical protein
MNPREMTSQFLALIGDPGAETIPEPLALRLLNDAQLTIANLMYPFYPSLFRTVTTDSGAGAKVFTLPLACAKLERVSIDDASGKEIDAIELPLEYFNATVRNDFYLGALEEGQVFYTHRGDRQIEVSPAVANEINYYYQKEPTQMRYDHGQGRYTTDDSTYWRVNDSSKVWGVAEYEQATSYFRILENISSPTGNPIDPDQEIAISGNTYTRIDLPSAPAGVGNNEVVEYEVYTPSDIPKKFRPLIVKRAVANQDPTRAEQLKQEIKEELMVLTGAGGR